MNFLENPCFKSTLMSSPFLLLPSSDKQLPVYPYSIRKFFFGNSLFGAYSFVLLLNFSILVQQSYAQRNENTWWAGVHSGMLVFYGDVKTNDFFPSLSPFNELRAGAGANLSYLFNPVFGLRMSFTAGKLAGANQAADEYFKANILDYSLQGIFNLNTIFFYDYIETPVDIYAMVGYGFVEFRSIRRRLSDDGFIQAFGYAANGSKSAGKTREMMIPVGFIIQSSVNKLTRNGSNFLSNTDITLEFTLANANTNKLDANLTIREVKDKYSYFSIGLVYNFN